MSARWAEPALLHLAALLPALLLAALLLVWRRRTQVADAAPWMDGRALRRFPFGRAALLLPAAALLGVAAAGPRRGPAAAADGEGGDVVLLVDASNSMLAADVAPNRLERARALARALAERTGGRMGVVAFGGTAHVLSPLTSDAGALALYLNALSPEVVSQGGSSLASALRRGASLLPDGGTMVLVSDGEALEPPEITAAALAEVARRGIAVHTVGIGTAQGGRVPDRDPLTGARRGWKLERDGRPTVSRLDRPSLERIARRTAGTFRLDPGPAGAAALAAAASADAAADGAGNRYRWPLGLALALVAADALAARRRGRR